MSVFDDRNFNMFWEYTSNASLQKTVQSITYMKKLHPTSKIPFGKENLVQRLKVLILTYTYNITVLIVIYSHFLGLLNVSNKALQY